MTKIKKQPFLNIVITTYNRYNDLLNCLKSIKDSTYKNFSIIIIDDCSTDETKYLNSFELKKKTNIKQKIAIIHNKKRLMMVKSRNLGAKKSKSKYILFIDDDNIIDKKMIEILINFAEKHPEYGIIGPSMYYADGKLYMKYQIFNFFTGKTTGVIVKNSNPKEYYDSIGVPNVFLIRKSVFDKIGYFDSKIIQTFTEMDFGLKALKNEIKCCMLSAAKTIHNTYEKNNYTPRSLSGQFNQTAYFLMRNRTIIITRYGNFFQKIIYFIFFSWFWPLIYSFFIILFLKFNILKYYWCGFFDGLFYFFTRKIKNSLPRLMK